MYHIVCAHRIIVLTKRAWIVERGCRGKLEKESEVYGDSKGSGKELHLYQRKRRCQFIFVVVNKGSYIVFLFIFLRASVLSSTYGMSLTIYISQNQNEFPAYNPTG